MATSVQIGTCNDDVRKLNKSFSGTGVSCRIKEPCDILYPTIIVDYNSSFANANYVYIPEWGRYYFIDNITVAPGHTMMIHCVVDVLNSWKNSISNITTDILVNEGKGQFSEIKDEHLVCENRTLQRYYNFSGSELAPITFASSNPSGIYNYIFIKTS